MPATKAPNPSALADFRRLDQSGQLAQLRGQHCARVCTVERDGIDREARTVWLSIASEEPYERWWGVEILDHSKSSIRDARLKAGAPLLVGHDTADQVGVVERYEISPAKKLRILARFGRSARAEEIWQDVLDGIRRNTSVGYVIHDLVLERSEGDIKTYRVTDWEPLEGSLVPVPADFTVGVGRQFNSKGNDMHEAKDDLLENDQPQSRGQRRREATAQDAEYERVNNLLAAGAAYARFGGHEVARELIKDKTATEETLKARMADKMCTRGTPLQTAGGGFGTEMERHHFGEGARVRVNHGKLQCFTGRDGARQALTMGHWLRAQTPGHDDSVRFLRENGIELQRYMTGSTGTAGGYTVPEELAAEVIRNIDTYGVYRQEARNWPMNSDSLSIPKRTGGVTAAFVTEDTEATASDPAFGSVGLLAKEVIAKTHITRSVLEDSVIDLGDFVAMEMAEAFAQLEDQCGFIGDGTSTYGGMQGIVPKLLAATASQVTAATAHDLASEIDMTDLANLMAKLPQYAQRGAKWYMSTAFYGAIVLRLLLSGGGNTPSTLEKGGSINNPMFAGFPVVLTPVLPSDTAEDLSGDVMLMFGNLQRAAAFGDRRVIGMMIDPYTLAGKSQIRIIGSERFHIVNHDVGDTTRTGPMVALIGN